jgi:hypothetical protein
VVTYIAVLWVMSPCGVVGDYRGTYCFRLQGREDTIILVVAYCLKYASCT